MLFVWNGCCRNQVRCQMMSPRQGRSDPKCIMREVWSCVLPSSVVWTLMQTQLVWTCNTRSTDQVKSRHWETANFTTLTQGSSQGLESKEVRILQIWDIYSLINRFCQVFQHIFLLQNFQYIFLQIHFPLFGMKLTKVKVFNTLD